MVAVSTGIKFKRFIILTVFFLSLASSVAAIEIPGRGVSNGPSYVEGEILIKLDELVSTSSAQSMIEARGEHLLRTSGKDQIRLVQLAPGRDVEQAVNEYRAQDGVVWAQPNYIYRTTAEPTDSSYNQLWGLKNSGQTISSPGYGTNNPGLLGRDIDAELAWDHITDCSSVIVAVIDTGINYTHQDLAANMWNGGASFPNHGWDTIDGDNDPYPVGGAEDHGTHVAGTIAAVGNNSSGITGICWQAQIMSVRVINASGFGTSLSVVDGIDWATNHDAHVINMSLGLSAAADSAINSAINRALASDVVVVTAAGNSSRNNDSIPQLPCNQTQANVVCVAALDQGYQLASFSNYGATSVDVGAPGTNILSTWAGTFYETLSNGWTLSGGWAAFGTASSCLSADGIIWFEMLSNPTDWCTAPAPSYANNVADTAYRQYDLSGFAAAELSYYVLGTSEAGLDFLETNYKSTGGDPFVSGTNLVSVSGSISDYYTYDLSSCLTSTCSVGYRLGSNNTIVEEGFAITLFELNTLEANSNSFNVIDGTSMAAPHVAGIAAMVRAYNPGYTYIETVNAIKYGGEDVVALASITSTGKAANAMGSLAYINTPTGVTAAVQ